MVGMGVWEGVGMVGMMGWEGVGVFGAMVGEYRSVPVWGGCGGGWECGDCGVWGLWEGMVVC